MDYLEPKQARAIRKHAGLTLDTLAKQWGVSKSLLSLVECGHIRMTRRLDGLYTKLALDTRYSDVLYSVGRQ